MVAASQGSRRELILPVTESKSKGPGARAYLAGVRTSQEAKEAGAERTRGQEELESK